MKAILLAGAALAAGAHAAVQNADVAAGAINEFGLQLHRRLAKPEGNVCISPYSIQGALAMTFAGADGATRAEMAKVLHFPEGEEIHASFAALNAALEEVTAKTAKQAAAAGRFGGPSEPITLNVANRLFGQKGAEFRAPFLALLEGTYRAPMEALDFRQSPEEARGRINGWVEEKTRERIRELLKPGMIGKGTRLVLVNAVYLKAPWADEFSGHATAPEPFHVNGGAARPVPTMRTQRQLGYAEQPGFRAVAIPYAGNDVQFLVIVPEKVDGLAEVEKGLTAAGLSQLAKMAGREVFLHLPKIRIEGDGIDLGDELKALGMRTAFDEPPGSADFSRMAPRTPQDYLAISKVVHKTFLALDEKGTEAAAATAVIAIPGSAPMEPKKPLEVKVDRPFLFAIQHVPSGACLFLGRVGDPAGR